MSLADLPCKKCANCKDLSVIAFPLCTPYVFIECPKLPVGINNPEGVGYIYLNYPFTYECREFVPKEVRE